MQNTIPLNQKKKNDSHVQKDNNERKFVDASHIIKNLGK